MKELTVKLKLPTPLLKQTKNLLITKRFESLCMVSQVGFEPTTDALEGRCSIQLSY